MTANIGTSELSGDGESERQGAARAEAWKDVLWAAVLSIALGVAYQLTYGSFSLNMRDEGYLWYGVQQVLAGDVPMRDFQSYDPGRYYYSAWLSPIFGTGIVGIRASLVAFACVGLCAGLLVVRRLVPSRAWLVPAAILLGISMFPRHKLFEPSVVMIAVWTTTRLIEQPSRGRVFFAGLVIGLAAIIGRNHGLYLVIGYSALFLIGLWRRLDAKPWRSAAILTGGVTLGYSPLLGMLVLVPGFARAFLDAVFSVRTLGSNLVKPYQWPWTSSLLREDSAELIIEDPHWIIEVGRVAVDGAYLLPVIILPVGFLILLRLKAQALRENAAFVASILLGIPYAYHYAICSDVPHLFQAIQPVLLGTLGLAALGSVKRLRMGISLGALLVMILLVSLTRHPELKHLVKKGFEEERMQLEVHGDVLRVPVNLGNDIEMVRRVINQFVLPEDELLILPTMPTYYPILAKRSPSWWIYLLFKSSDEEQNRIINELKERDVKFILTIARPFNRESEFNLNETNPILWQYILRNHKRFKSEDVLPMPLRIHLWIHNSKL